MHGMISLSDRRSTNMANVDEAWSLSRRRVESILAPDGPEKLALGKPQHMEVERLMMALCLRESR